MFFCSSLVISIIVLDQIIKYVISANMFVGESIPVIPQILHLTYILNAGAAFGILANQRYFFIAIAAILVIIAIYFYPQIQRLSRTFQIAIAMLLAGAIGNMIDRIATGKVVDYIDIRIWPIFNLADVAIVLGCIVIIYELLFTGSPRTVSKKRKDRTNNK